MTPSRSKVLFASAFVVGGLGSVSALAVALAGADLRVAEIETTVMAAPEWALVNIPGDWTGSYFTSLDMLASGQEGWAVGNKAPLYFDGDAWQTRTTTMFTQTLIAVDIITASDVWAVGDGGAISHYDGSTWTDVASPVTNTVVTLYDVTMLSSSEGWAVGSRGTIVHYDGARWTLSASPVNKMLMAVAPVSVADVWAVGDGGTFLHYDGISWGIVSVPSVGVDIVADVDALGADDAWAVTSGGSIVRYDGSAWMAMNSPTTRPVWAIDMCSSNEGWAVGFDLLYYNGREWVLTEEPWTQCGDETVYSDVVMLGSADGWAGGICRTIIRYSLTSGDPSDEHTIFFPRAECQQTR